MRLTYRLSGAHSRTSSSVPCISWERRVCSHFAHCDVSVLWRNDKYCGLDESIDKQLPLIYFWEPIVLVSPGVLSRELFPSNNMRQNNNREEFSHRHLLWSGFGTPLLFSLFESPKRWVTSHRNNLYRNLFWGGKGSLSEVQQLHIGQLRLFSNESQKSPHQGKCQDTLAMSHSCHPPF